MFPYKNNECVAIAKCILLELLNSSTFLRQSIYFKLESNTPAFLVTHTQFE